MARICHGAWQLMLFSGFACLPAAGQHSSVGASSLEKCGDGEPDSPGGACAVLAYDDPVGLSLLQRSASQRHGLAPPGHKDHHALSSKTLAGRTADQAPGPQAPLEEAAVLQLEDVTDIHAATMADARVTSNISGKVRWPWSPSPPPTPSCNGVYAQYSDVNLEDNMTFEFKSANSEGMRCLEQGPYGPNKCCVAWGSNSTILGQVKLPQDLGAEATISASVSGWYGWIPLADSLQCKACGEDCRACPSISKFLPFLFPCKPVPMPPCPLKAGTHVNATSIVSWFCLR
ncbi:unnamed protein product [Polarella glacialis]|uniref:Uncharacterized protein n=1 Tax=Polarella glacialis TaxID=89957 RepID=A0A813FC38_POLGL|nr:unnamed protein product [Polarella glacialis]